MGKSIKTIAMIAVAVFAPYAAASLGLTGFAATAFSFVLQTAVGAILGNFGEKAGGGGGVQDGGMLVNKQGNVSPIPVVYGQRRLGGTRVYVETTDGSGNPSGTEYLHLVIAMGQGGTQADGTDSLKDITKIIFNDRDAWTPGGGIDSYFSGLVTIRAWLGKNDQTVASPDYSAGSFPISTQWTSNHRMRGVAYVYVILKYDRDKLPGAPTVLIETSGKRMQDVNNLGVWSDSDAIMRNPANCLYDYLTNVRYGKGIPAGDINLASFQSAAAWATSAGVEFNGALSTADTLYNNTQRLIGNGNMNLVYVNGEYQIQPVKQESFVGAYDFNTSNILGKWNITLGNKKSRFNTMKVNFFNPAEEWQADSVLIEDAGYLAEDSGVVNEKTIELPLISDQTLATKIGRYYLDVSRYQTMVSFKATWSALNLQVGDPVTITHDVPGWTLEKFRVNSITLLADGTVDVVLEQYAPDSVYLENN